MNKEKLKLELIGIGINENFYSLNGDVSKPGSLVLENDGNRWIILGISDKGKQDLIKSFSNESEACIYLFNKLSDFNKVVQNSKKEVKENSESSGDSDIINL
jgi:hypothetical protein